MQSAQKQRNQNSEFQEKNMKQTLLKPIQRKYEDQTKNLFTKDKMTIINKRNIQQQNDGKKTIKIKIDKKEQLINKLIRDSSQFQSRQKQKQQQYLIEQEKQFILIIGFIKNLKNVSQENRNKYKIVNKQCIQFELNNNYLIFIDGRINFIASNQLEIGLYLPQRMRINLAQNQDSCKLLPIIIRRQIFHDNYNPMDYPYLIVSPYQLLYPSVIFSWISCRRKITLDKYLRAESTFNQPMIFGSCSHRYFQWLISNPATVLQTLETSAKQIYMSYLYDMYLIQCNFQDFYSKCKKSMINIKQWYCDHIKNSKKIEINSQNGKYIKILESIGSQVMIRSKYFGVKGKLDAWFAGELICPKQNKTIQIQIPFQLKTSVQFNSAQKRQLELYCLLVREVTQETVIGILYSSQSRQIVFKEQDPLKCFEILNDHRNQIVANQSQLYQQQSKIILPKFAQGMPQCNKCDVNFICQAISRMNFKNLNPHKNNTQLNSNFSKISDIEDLNTISERPSKYYQKIKQVMDIMTNQELQYLQKWFHLLHIEQCFERKQGSKCQKIGFCHFQITIAELNKIKKLDSHKKLQLWIYRIQSNKQNLFFLSQFYALGQKLRIFLHEINMVQNCKIMAIRKIDEKNCYQMQIQINNNDVQFNISQVQKICKTDKKIQVQLQNFQNQAFSRMRNTVCKFIKHGSNEMKQLILLGKKIQTNKSSKIVSPEEIPNQLKMNQKQAYRLCLQTENYCFIRGFPGTGKTYLVVCLLQKFAQEGKRILMTSFTNRSLQNILVRLLENNAVARNCIIREGSRYSMEKLGEDLNPRSQDFSSIQQYQQYFNNKFIWFVTLSSLSIHHIPSYFDVVILDQASQCLEPLCLEGIIKSKKIIMIGDYQQLQPLVRSDKALEGGMGLSLFERLCKTCPEVTVSLKYQYRMNYEIMQLSNLMIYEGQLEVANSETKNKRLKLNTNWCENIPLSFQQVINPQNVIRFLNYDKILQQWMSKEENKDKYDQLLFTLEIQFTVYMLHLLLSLGMKRQNCAVISVYNKTIDQIIRLSQKFYNIQELNGTILTVDRSQGIDRQVIIFLLQRGNQLMENPRRLNVAITRAQSKLIVIGSKNNMLNMNVCNGQLSNILTAYQEPITLSMLNNLLK